MGRRQHATDPRAPRQKRKDSTAESKYSEKTKQPAAMASSPPLRSPNAGPSSGQSPPAQYQYDERAFEQPIQVDDDDHDSSYDDTDAASQTTSLRSEAFKFVYENGRRYQNFRGGAYWYVLFDFLLLCFLVSSSRHGVLSIWE